MDPRSRSVIHSEDVENGKYNFVILGPEMLSRDDSPFAKRYKRRTGSSAPPAPFSERLTRRELAPQRSHMGIRPSRARTLAPPVYTASRGEAISELHRLCLRADHLGVSRFGPVLRCSDGGDLTIPQPL
jgi:hypothetical protein